MEARGHHVIVEENKTFAVVLEEKLEIYVREKSTQVLNKERYSWQTRDLIPNGKLCFRYYRYSPEKEWVDNTLPIEDKIPHIIAYLEVKATEEKQARREREEWHRQYEEEQRKKREFQKRKAKELADFKTMLTLSNRYQKAIELRNYIETVKSYSIKSGSISEELQTWIEWAKKKADWFDPFTNAPDEYLDDTDKNNIN